jgi:hypothetical protein
LPYDLGSAASISDRNFHALQFCPKRAEPPKPQTNQFGNEPYVPLGKQVREALERLDREEFSAL